MAKNDFQYGRWNVAQSWHWFCQVTAPCNVACGSGIMTVNSPIGSTLQCDTWLWDDMPLNSTGGSTMNVTYSSGIMTFARWQHPAMWKGGSGMTCHGIRWNVCHIGILHLVSILTISPQSTCHSAPVWEILSKSDHSQHKKWRHVDFQDGGSHPSWILRIQ